MSDPIETESVSPSRRGFRKGIYLVPSAFTIGNILCGFYAVINAVKGYQLLLRPEEAAQLFDGAARAIGLAVLLDGLDGRIARLTNTTSDFGVELDSIADVLSFGIAPAVLAYAWGYGAVAEVERLGWAVSFFFLICGALRLARFNVMARAPRFAAGSTPKLDKRYFVGLPIPPAAGALAAVVHFVPQPLPAYDPALVPTYCLALIAGMACLALLMVSTLKYTSFKNIGPHTNKPFIVLPLLSLLVAVTWFHSQWVLLLLTCTYVLHGPVLKLVNLCLRLRRPATGEEQPASAPAES